MIRHGEAPYLECSTRGDRRFSAFGARLYGTTIEEIYQLSKVFADGTSPLHWREGKGRHAVNSEALAELYEMMWRLYLAHNPHLLPVLCQATGLSDMFGQKGHVCQATVLWKIRGELIVDTSVTYADTEHIETNNGSRRNDTQNHSQRRSRSRRS